MVSGIAMSLRSCEVGLRRLTDRRLDPVHQFPLLLDAPLERSSRKRLNLIALHVSGRLRAWRRRKSNLRRATPPTSSSSQCLRCAFACGSFSTRRAPSLTRSISAISQTGIPFHNSTSTSTPLSAKCLCFFLRTFLSTTASSSSPMSRTGDTRTSVTCSCASPPPASPRSAPRLRT